MGDNFDSSSPTYGLNTHNVTSHTGPAAGHTTVQLPADGYAVQPLSPTDVRTESSVSSNDLIYNDPVSRLQELNDDDRRLAKMGYRSVLNRGFDGLMNFSFCFTAVAVISSITAEYTYGLATGGPVVTINGWLVCSFFTILTGCIMAEICSVYPNAGSVYYWAGMLAPKKYAPISAFVTGWFNLLGNAAGDASYCFAFGSVLYEMLTYAYPTSGLWALGNTNPNSNQIVQFEVGIGIACAVIWGIINCLPIHKQGWVNNTGALWQVSATVVIIAVLFAMSPQLQTSSFVWTTSNNETGFNTSATAAVGDTGAGSMVYLSCIGLLTSLFSFSGYEAGGHLAEETTNANRSAPLGIVATTVVSAIVGFLYLLSLLYNTFYDQYGYLSSQDPVTIMINVLGVPGGLTLASVLLINFFFSGIASLTVTTRVMFAMARDGAVPFGKQVAYIAPHTKTPVMSVLVVVIFDIVLICITLGATEAFYAITGLTTIGYQISYAIPITWRLLSKDFVKGPIHLGRYSIVIGWISVAFLVITSIFFFWPTAYPVNAVDMNYTVVVVGAVFIFAMVYWIVSARFHYIGPHQRHEMFEAKYGLYLKEHGLTKDAIDGINDDGSTNSDDKEKGNDYHVVEGVAV